MWMWYWKNMGINNNIILQRVIFVCKVVPCSLSLDTTWRTWLLNLGIMCKDCCLQMSKQLFIYFLIIQNRYWWLVQNNSYFHSCNLQMSQLRMNCVWARGFWLDCVSVCLCLVWSLVDYWHGWFSDFIDVNLNLVSSHS